MNSLGWLEHLHFRWSFGDIPHLLYLRVSLTYRNVASELKGPWSPSPPVQVRNQVIIQSFFPPTCNPSTRATSFISTTCLECPSVPHCHSHYLSTGPAVTQLLKDAFPLVPATTLVSHIVPISRSSFKRGDAFKVKVNQIIPVLCLKLSVVYH